MYVAQGERESETLIRARFDVEKGDVLIVASRRSRTGEGLSCRLTGLTARRQLAPETLIPRCAARDISFSAVFSN